METQEKIAAQDRSSDQQESRWSYESSPWIDVWDFQVTEHQRQDGEGSWWDVKLANGTFIEHNGERLDVSRYHFSTNVEPSFTYGEPGQPGAMRGIHYPDGWQLDLRRFANTAPEGQPPSFVETGRIEGVSPDAVSAGVRERNRAWKLSHQKAHPDQIVGEQVLPERGEAVRSAAKETLGPSL